MLALNLVPRLVRGMVAGLTFNCKGFSAVSKSSTTFVYVSAHVAGKEESSGIGYTDAAFDNILCNKSINTKKKYQYVPVAQVA